MTCCSSGKARVYYNISTQGGLKYRLKGQNKWNSILANEKLGFSCFKKVKLYRVTYITGNGESVILPVLFAAPVKVETIYSGNRYAYESPYGIHTVTGTTTELYSGGFWQDFWYWDPGHFVQELVEESMEYKFTITGTETGTKYLEIEVDECPDVQTIPCKFDPAKEQYIDVEMSTSPNVESCIDVVEADPNPITGGLGVHIILIKIVRDHKGGPRPPIWSSRGYFYSPKGCPPPKVRVECCTTPDCQNNKKCPKETTCELICNGFKCCYRNNKLIRSIKL